MYIIERTKRGRNFAFKIIHSIDSNNNLHESRLIKLRNNPTTSPVVEIRRTKPNYLVRNWNALQKISPTTFLHSIGNVSYRNCKILSKTWPKPNLTVLICIQWERCGKLGDIE